MIFKAYTAYREEEHVVIYSDSEAHVWYSMKLNWTEHEDTHRWSMHPRKGYLTATHPIFVNLFCCMDKEVI